MARARARVGLLYLNPNPNSSRWLAASATAALAAAAAASASAETAARGGEHGVAGGGERALVLHGPPRINPPPVGSGSSTDMARRLAAGGLGLGLGPGLGPGLGLAVGLAAPLGLRSRGLAGERRRAERATGGVSSRGLEPASETADGEERRGSDAKTGLGGGEPAL